MALISSTDRQTLEHESQDGEHDTNTEEQIATGILFVDRLTRSLKVIHFSTIISNQSSENLENDYLNKTGYNLKTNSSISIL